MNAVEFKEIRTQLPQSVAKNNPTLGGYLGVTHHSISKYQNMKGQLPDYIARGMLMLQLICRNYLLHELQDPPNPSAQ